MAYYNIVKRPRTDGTIRYRCTVGLKQGGKHVYRETKTFSKLVLAKTWGAKRVAGLEENGLPRDDDASKITVGELLRRYINDPSPGGKAGCTKSYVLNMLADCDIADISLSELSTAHIIGHCRQRNGTGASPSTVNHDVSYLSSVLNTAKPVYGINYTGNPACEARPRLIEMGLIGKSRRRSRRPVNDELDRMLIGLRKRSEHREGKIPYEDILNFSILSCMRIGEVCKILWADVDDEQRAVLVRDRKDPRKKVGNHMSVPLLGDAWTIPATPAPNG